MFIRLSTEVLMIVLIEANLLLAIFYFSSFQSSSWMLNSKLKRMELSAHANFCCRKWPLDQLVVSHPRLLPKSCCYLHEIPSQLIDRNKSEIDLVVASSFSLFCLLLPPFLSRCGARQTKSWLTKTQTCTKCSCANWSKSKLTKYKIMQNKVDYDKRRFVVSMHHLLA